MPKCPVSGQGQGRSRRRRGREAPALSPAEHRATPINTVASPLRGEGGVQPPNIRENGIRGAPWAAVNVCIPWRRLGQSSEAGQESAPGGCANMVAEAGRAKAAYRSTGACLFAVDPCHGFAQFVPPPRKTRRLLAKTPDLPGSSAQRARCPETWLRLNAQAAPRPRQLDPGAQRSSRAIECRKST